MQDQMTQLSNYPDKYKDIRFTGCLHFWWLLLLCSVIANGFHPTTHKIM